MRIAIVDGVGKEAAMLFCWCIMQNGLKIPIKVRDRIKIEKLWLNYGFNKIRSAQKNRGI